MTGSTNNKTIQAVIFDLDGVLLDSEWLAFLAWRELLAERGVSLDDSVFEGIVGLDDTASAEYVMARTGTTFEVEQYVNRIKQHMLKRVAGDVEPLPGAAQLVSRLAQHGLPLAIASNAFTGYVDTALTGLKLSPYFSARVGADKVARPKPAPDVYLSAAQALGVDPSRCMAVEDSRVGMQAASTAGMRVIAVPDRRAHPGPFPEAWREYGSLLELDKDLDILLR